MGGNAYAILGALDQRHLEQKPIKKTITDILLGRQRYVKPKEFNMGNTTIFEVPAHELDSLKREFVTFLRKAMPTPWRATTGTFEYFDLDIMTIYVRGDRVAGAKDIVWYVQLTFSGCAGMAQVSSNVAVHWADIWYKAERNKIQERLKQFGFHPENQPRDEGPAPLFFPLPESGYAEYSAEPEEVSFNDSKHRFHFSFDTAIEEAEPDQGIGLLQRLETGYASMAADGKCRCQLCSPDFNPKGLISSVNTSS